MVTNITYTKNGEKVTKKVPKLETPKKGKLTINTFSDIKDIKIPENIRSLKIKNLLEKENNFKKYKDLIELKFNDDYNINSTIKLSLKTKKYLDEINEKNHSYEDLILKLIKENNFLKNQMNYLKETNYINISFKSYQRIEKVFDYTLAKVKYSINKFSPLDDEFEYSITISTSVLDGQKIDLKNFYLMNYILIQDETEEILKEESEIIGEYMLYFLILFEQIKNDFNIKNKLNISLITKLEYWAYFFSKMGLTKSIYEKDILEAINMFKMKLNLKKKQRIESNYDLDYKKKLKKLANDIKK